MTIIHGSQQRPLHHDYKSKLYHLVPVTSPPGLGDLCLKLLFGVFLDSSCMSPYRAGSGSAIARVGL